MKFSVVFNDCPDCILHYPFRFHVCRGVASVCYGSLSLGKQDVILACKHFYSKVSELCSRPIARPFNLDSKSLKKHDLIVYLHGLLCDYECLLGKIYPVFINDSFLSSSLKKSRLPHGVLRDVKDITLELVSICDKNNKFLGAVWAHDGKVVRFFNSFSEAKSYLGTRYPSQLYNINFLIH